MKIIMIILVIIGVLSAAVLAMTAFCIETFGSTMPDKYKDIVTVIMTASLCTLAISAILFIAIFVAAFCIAFVLLCFGG